MDYAQQQRNLGKHLAGIALVILLHIAIVYALVTGLAHNVVEVIRHPVEAKIIEEIKPPETPPPPPRVVTPRKMAPPPPVYVPPPPAPVQVPQQDTITATTHVAPLKQPEPMPQVEAPPQPVRVAAVIDAQSACSKPEYPPMSLRFGEAGTVVLRFLIDVDGHVIESKVDKTSQYDRLDRAARDALSLCKFKPGTVDGKPEQTWATLKYVWKLP